MPFVSTFGGGSIRHLGGLVTAFLGISLNYQGGSGGATSVVQRFGTFATMPTPTQSGYNFSGWYDSASGGNKVADAGATYLVLQPKTLYAQWAVANYTVTYNNNGGTGGSSPVTVSTGATTTLPSAQLAGNKQTGYEFLGWYDAASGGNKIGNANATYTPSSSITLYAQFNAVTYFYCEWAAIGGGGGASIGGGGAGGGVGSYNMGAASTDVQTTLYLRLIKGHSYTVYIGAGGPGRPGVNGNNGFNGGNTYIYDNTAQATVTNYTAAGGGGGGAFGPGNNGGSGGGGGSFVGTTNTVVSGGSATSTYYGSITTQGAPGGSGRQTTYGYAGGGGGGWQHTGLGQDSNGNVSSTNGGTGSSGTTIDSFDKNSVYSSTSNLPGKGGDGFVNYLLFGYDSNGLNVYGGGGGAGYSMDQNNTASRSGGLGGGGTTGYNGSGFGSGGGGGYNGCGSGASGKMVLLIPDRAGPSSSVYINQPTAGAAAHNDTYWTYGFPPTDASYYNDYLTTVNGNVNSKFYQWSFTDTYTWTV
jgi:hypothetical protein